MRYVIFRFNSFLLLLLCLAAFTTLGGCEWGSTTTVEESSGDPAPIFERGPSPTEVQKERLAEAKQASEEGNYDNALALFREILASNPTVTTAYLGIGDIYVKQNDYSSAEPNYSRAARLEPRNFDAQYGHGLCLQMLNRFIEAVRAYHKALVIRPESKTANLNMATTYLQMGKPTDAEIFAEKAVEVDPGNGTAWVNLGAVRDQLGNYPDAIESYRTALELVEEPSQELRMNLVMALSKDQRYQETINAAETVNQIEPNSNAWERTGWAWFRLKNYEQSISAYNKAVEIDPKHWVAWNGVGVNALNRWILSKKRDSEAKREAGNALRQSLRINTNQDKIIQLITTYRL